MNKLIPAREWQKYFDKCEWEDSQAFVVSCKLLLWCGIFSQCVK